MPQSEIASDFGMTGDQPQAVEFCRLFVTPSPVSPSPWEGEDFYKRGASAPLTLPVINPDLGESKRGFASLFISSPSPLKERGTKGVR